jgi:hypothetical protein
MDRDPQDRRDDPPESPLEKAARRVQEARAKTLAAQREEKEAEAALLDLARRLGT